MLSWRRHHLLFVLLLAAITSAAMLTVLAREAHGQSGPDTLYGLGSPPSSFEYGCMGACACPLFVQGSLAGTFHLVLRANDPVARTSTYDVRDVRWNVPAPYPATITGAGTFTRTDGSSSSQRLVLDLTFDGGAVQHFDSGVTPLGAGYPEIKARVSLHGEVCHDSVLALDAKPLDPASVAPSPAAGVLRASPNPFTGATALQFTLPTAGPVTLAIYDVTGRHVRTLVHEWLGAGPVSRTWNGRRDDGGPAMPGLYLARLDSGAGRATKLIVRLAHPAR